MRTVEIIESRQENTKKEQYQLKHFSNGIVINSLESGTIIKFSKLDRLHVKDDETGDDYEVTVLRGNDGDLYYTSSEFFTREVNDIISDFDPAVDGDENGLLTIKVLKKESATRKGSDGKPVLFLTCELV